jgi:AcrR family transcriptional regulator
VIQAALELVAADGPNALNVEALGSRIPVSPNALTALFGSRERLVAEVLRRWEDLTRE